MHRVATGAKVAVFVIFFLSILGSAFAQSPQPTVCNASEYHQLDFWVGDWDTFDIGSKTPNARVHVDRILGGCVLHEDYQGTDGLKGQSFSIYDATRGLWHQSWVTNRGQLLIIEGKLEGGSIVLNGADHTDSGQERLVRGTWKPENGGVRETAIRSLDGGKTWQPWFDIIFHPHKQ